jgi:radical SAM protein with 4Fe4S-binding SPASM domain
MECTEKTWPSNREFLREFNKKSALLRTPLIGSIELTSRCNLKCVHCYLGPPSSPNQQGLKEMSTGKILSIIDEITEAGCLNLLFTGGEPFLRKDFNIIYSHAKKNGLLVTVFSNGTLVTDDIASLFVDLPPQAVEISLYGATKETYEKITGVNGSYERCLRGISQLLEHRINVKLKTILMTINRHEFFEIENIAKDLGVKFRFDAAIFSKLNGDKSPISLRVSPEEAVDKEFSDMERFCQWKNFFNKVKSIPEQDALYTCGAGLNSFYIDSYGNLKPCLMITSLAYKLEKGNFKTGWHDVISLIREKKPGHEYKCRGCEKAPLCGYCPAFFALEKGSEDLCSEYLCEIGRIRFQKINIDV